MVARIIYKKADGSTDTILVKDARNDYELHDGDVRYKGDTGEWNVLPMHRVFLIEE